MFGTSRNACSANSCRSAEENRGRFGAFSPPGIDRENQLVEDARRAHGNVEMPIGDGIERAGIDRDRAAPLFSVHSDSSASLASPPHRSRNSCHHGIVVGVVATSPPDPANRPSANDRSTGLFRSRSREMLLKTQVYRGFPDRHRGDPYDEIVWLVDARKKAPHARLKDLAPILKFGRPQVVSNDPCRPRHSVRRNRPTTAPRDKVSMPTLPLPAYRSSARSGCDAERCEHRKSRLANLVGHRTRTHAARRLQLCPRALPLMTRMRWSSRNAPRRCSG